MRSTRLGVALACAGGLVTGGPAHAATAMVTVSNNRYAPLVVTIAAGDTVTWEWALGVPGTHSVTADDGSFDSHPGCTAFPPFVNPSCGIPDVSAYSVTFLTPGTYGYYCRVHGRPGGAGMAGQVVVS